MNILRGILLVCINAWWEGVKSRLFLVLSHGWTGDNGHILKHMKRPAPLFLTLLEAFKLRIDFFLPVQLKKLTDIQDLIRRTHTNILSCYLGRLRRMMSHCLRSDLYLLELLMHTGLCHQSLGYMPRNVYLAQGFAGKNPRRAVWCLFSHLVKRHVSPLVYFYLIAKYAVHGYINTGGQSLWKVYFCSHVFFFNQGIALSMLLIWRHVEGKQVTGRSGLFSVGWHHMAPNQL